MEGTALKTTLHLFIIILFFMILPRDGWSNDYSAKGNIENTIFSVNYSKDSHNIRIEIQDKAYNFELTGYDATNFYIGDINNDGNDEVVYLDLSGVSAGGELQILIWNGDSFREVQGEYYATTLRIDCVNNHSYILLMQHDTQDLFYVSDVLKLKNMSLYRSREKSPWNKIITEYTAQMNGKMENWKKSRYHAYIASAYKIIGNVKKAKYHFKRASQLDKHNPLLSKIE